MNPVNIFEGCSQIILAQPHGGTFFPTSMNAIHEFGPTLNENGLKFADTECR